FHGITPFIRITKIVFLNEPNTLDLKHMNKIVWALGLTIVSSTSFITPVSSQVSENFSDGDITHNPEWLGNVPDFTILSGMLRLQAPPVAGQSYLATPSLAIRNAVW